MKWIALALVLVVASFFTAGAGQTQGTKRKADPLLQLHSWLWPPRKGVPIPTSTSTPEKPAPPAEPVPHVVASIGSPPAEPVPDIVASIGSPPAEPVPLAERPKPKPKPKPKAEQQGRERPTHRFDEGPDLPYSCGQVCMAKAMFSQAYLEAEGRRRGYGTKAARQARTCMRQYCPG